MSYTGLSPAVFFCSSVSLSLASSTSMIKVSASALFSNISARTSFSIITSPSEVAIEIESMLLLFSIFFEIVSKSETDIDTDVTVPSTLSLSTMLSVFEPDATVS